MPVRRRHRRAVPVTQTQLPTGPGRDWQPECSATSSGGIQVQVAGGGATQAGSVNHHDDGSATVAVALRVRLRNTRDRATARVGRVSGMTCQ